MIYAERNIYLGKNIPNYPGEMIKWKIKLRPHPVVGDSSFHKVCNDT